VQSRSSVDLVSLWRQSDQRCRQWRRMSAVRSAANSHRQPQNPSRMTGVLGQC
jgi:hypothetical protein